MPKHFLSECKLSVLGNKCEMIVRNNVNYGKRIEQKRKKKQFRQNKNRRKTEMDRILTQQPFPCFLQVHFQIQIILTRSGKMSSERLSKSPKLKGKKKQFQITKFEELSLYLGY